MSGGVALEKRWRCCHNKCYLKCLFFCPPLIDRADPGLANTYKNQGMCKEKNGITNNAGVEKVGLYLNVCKRQAVPCKGKGNKRGFFNVQVVLTNTISLNVSVYILYIIY